jgi:isoleucyl-tRNA synthetase
MKANLPQLEPRIIQKWEDSGIYQKILEANRTKPKYILHDGPPYANGNIHLGHALNKILKDIIVKYKNMRGFFSVYVPGWDCHGLPIELQVEKSLKGKKRNLPKMEIRKLCRAYAERFVEIQREEFKRLGVMGLWDKPYLTMDPRYEACELRELGTLVARGMVYRGFKPVHWCPSCQTALAEAEVEYEEVPSPSIYVKFPVKDPKGKFPVDPVRGTHFVIWTTTPWTLPANQAIALHPHLMYRHVKTPAGELILAQDLVPELMKTFGFREWDYETTPGAWAGAELEGILCLHPWLRREAKVILGEFVTKDQGTGCVHIAPGHGQEDHEAGQRYGLETLAPVNAEGKFTSDAGDLAGEPVFKANSKIVEKLRSVEALLAEEKLNHSYPHCWRCKKPVIFRATHQWFVSMEAQRLRAQALEEIEKVQWVPPWGRERIAGMIQNRPDWCISRQRSWGLPLPFLYCQSCGKELADQRVLESASDFFYREGSDAWFVHPPEAFLPSGMSCPRCHATSFRKEEDILDVWFDSGSSYAGVLEQNDLLRFPADLYLEGSDQHRGWFHSSLLVSVGARGCSPYRAVLTHGFTVDGAGKKMSKSQGNVLAPQKIIEQHGAEILRLWVASENYRDDIRISQEILNRLGESYRRLRNTCRFLVANTGDFRIETDGVPYSELPELDCWILGRLDDVVRRCTSAYEAFEFHIVVHTLNHFCAVDLSSLYLDIVKDRLYCSAGLSKERRAAQTVLLEILEKLLRLMAPILSFTAEEIWGYLHGEDRAESVFLVPFPSHSQEVLGGSFEDKWEKLFTVRGEVTKALELARAAKLIGHSLDAKVRISSPGSLQTLLSQMRDELPRVFIVSQVEIGDSQADSYVSDVIPGLRITVFHADGEKCTRCWNYAFSVRSHNGKPGVCGRCASVLAGIRRTSAAPPESI